MGESAVKGSAELGVGEALHGAVALGRREGHALVARDTLRVRTEVLGGTTVTSGTGGGKEGDADKGSGKG